MHKYLSEKNFWLKLGVGLIKGLLQENWIWQCVQNFDEQKKDYNTGR